MIGTMSFSKDKHEKFCRCPKCYGETKHIQIRENDLSFGEVLSKELHRSKNIIRKQVLTNGFNTKRADT